MVVSISVNTNGKKSLYKYFTQATNRGITIKNTHFIKNTP